MLAVGLAKRHQVFGETRGSAGPRTSPRRLPHRRPRMVAVAGPQSREARVACGPALPQAPCPPRKTPIVRIGLYAAPMNLGLAGRSTTCVSRGDAGNPFDSRWKVQKTASNHDLVIAWGRLANARRWGQSEGECRQHHRLQIVRFAVEIERESSLHTKVPTSPRVEVPGRRPSPVPTASDRPRLGR
jgi:hypothetical protein